MIKHRLQKCDTNIFQGNICDINFKARHIISKRILVQKVGATNKTLKIRRLGCILSCNQAVFSTKADLTKMLSKMKLKMYK